MGVNVEFGYGKGHMGVDIPLTNLLGVLHPKDDSGAVDYKTLVRAALDAPLGTASLEKLVRRGQKVALLISDVTRPCPSYKLLPPVLERLSRGGVRREDITIVSGLGSHRPQTKDEHKKLVGSDVYERYRVEDSLDSGYVAVGTSRRGTVYEVCRRVAEADVRVAIGNIDYHYFAGYSGGAKALMPGVCSRRSIEMNHRMMLEPGATVGNLDHNPVRDDIEEVLSFLSLDFILNVVLNEKKEIAAVVAGDAIAAHRAGAKALDDLYQIPIYELADIVITSVGGAPKDINVYQTQKALDNAKWAVKKGGVIILVGECSEGFGEGIFAQWLAEAACPQDLTERIRREFRLGGHKAAAIAAVAQEHTLFFVSSMPEALARRLFAEPFGDLQSAFNAALAKVGPKARVYCLPVGGTTLPRLQP